jgi:hypothetical protein
MYRSLYHVMLKVNVKMLNLKRKSITNIIIKLNIKI